VSDCHDGKNPPSRLHVALGAGFTYEQLEDADEHVGNEPSAGPIREYALVPMRGRTGARIVEELCQDEACPRDGTHWHPFDLEDLLRESVGEYTITVRVREGKARASRRRKARK